jgi:5-oxoprolinase (ATP-hydrolysing) subunit A
MDINCDLGEGIGKDEQIMPFISSCNIACGIHAGSMSIMKSTVQLAMKNNVQIGAHPSFSDRENFGRKEMFIPKDILKSQIINQIASLNEIAKKEGTKLHHVKPHGALYNMASKFNDVAMAVIDAVQFFDEDLILYVPYGSLIAYKARKFKVPYYNEVFADRNYNDDLTLVSREEPEAIIENPSRINERILRIISEGTIVSLNGKIITMKADTVCVHGDNPNAVNIVKDLAKVTHN